MDTSRRVVVTGTGAVSPLSLSTEGLWNALLSGESGVRPYAPLSSVPLPIRFASDISGFNGEIDSFGKLDPNQKKAIRKALKVMSREIVLAVAAAQLALTEAGIAFKQIPSERVGVSFGSDYIVTTAEELLAGIRNCSQGGTFDFTCWAKLGLPKMTPLWQLKYLPNMPASHIAIFNEFHGPNNSMTLREASIGAVIGESVEIIKSGKADVILAGTTGSRIHPYKLVEALQQEELAPPDSAPETACRPFDQDRCGTVLGEGAGSLILEELEHARKRGATIYAEVIAGSYTTTFDRRILGQPGPEGNAASEQHKEKLLRETLVRSMRHLLRRVGARPEEIGHVNAHGLGSRLTDRAEAGAVHEVFGKCSRPIPVTAAKGHFGNLGAGAGAVELIAGILALHHGKLFPTLNHAATAADCPVHVVCRDKNHDADPGDSLIKLAFNRQAQASALLVRKFTE